MILNKNIAAAALLLAGAASPAAARLRVVATFSVLGDWVRQVGGTDVDLTVLVGPGGDAHAYEPAPADGRTLTGADVVVGIGLGFEPWLDKLWSVSGSRARRVSVADGARLRRVGTETDPHVWGDPTNAARAVEVLRDAFIAADPAQAKAYRRRAAAYAAQLSALDAWIRAQAARVPPERRLLVTVHDNMGYWADRCGFRVLETLLSSLSTEAADPSAGRLARLSDEIRARKVPALFVDNVSNHALARAVARDAGIRVAPPLYADALGASGTPGDTYVGMMRHDTRVIVEALAP